MIHPRLTSLVALTLITGCGGKTAATIACASFASAYCSKLDACEKDGIARVYGDRATCESRQKDNCEISLEAPDTGSTPQGKVNCATAYGSASCRDFLYGGIAACSTVTGSRSAGSPCAFGPQCQSGMCSFAFLASCGVCAGVSRAGSACPCSVGFVCLSTGCQPGGNEGASCSTTAPCLSGLTCVGGTCQLYATTVGQACPCDSYAGFACVNSACVAQTFATSGLACGTFTSGFVGCTGGATCVYQTGATQGTCTPYALEGQPCGSPGASCRVPDRCVGSGTSGTCVTVDPSKC